MLSWHLFSAYVMKEQCFLVRRMGVGEEWLFWAGIKQKCRARWEEVVNAGRWVTNVLKEWLWNVVASGVQRVEISSKQCIWVGNFTSGGYEELRVFAVSRQRSVVEVKELDYFCDARLCWRFLIKKWQLLTLGTQYTIHQVQLHKIVLCSSSCAQKFIIYTIL